ncbi:BEN domain-containing protein 7 isoform X3 [Microcaecilia unicolor]|uniref:BEN domain-containing protein 7 isoform X3 n=1 Tax=Microcaecilia unicolor TaxID=1415580 RepID=A0A6P7Z5N2_9AMPH|nr:BEN domain-containing protein 7 isoform X3 [Microcaecilia unicolor]
MEFSERKRSRKSQSFKLVNEDYHDVYKVSGYSSDVNGETKEAPQFVGDEGLEIRKQITGMRRLLNDSTGRTYQRIGKEGEKLKEEPQELEMAWGTQSPPSPPRPRDNLHPSRSTSWNDVSPQTSYYSGQYGTRSKTVHNQVKSTVASNGEVPVLHSSSGSSCCTCSCQPTLQAILQELRAMRKFIQIQAAAQNRLQPPLSCVCAQRSTAVRKRNRKKKAPEKAAAAVTPARKPSLLANESKLTTVVECSRLPGADHIPKEENNTSGFGIVHEAASSSSDKCNLLKDLVCLWLNLSWTLFYQITHAQEACCSENWCVRFSTTRLWPIPCPMGREKEGSMITAKGWIRILWAQ